MDAVRGDEMQVGAVPENERSTQLTPDSNEGSLIRNGGVLNEFYRAAFRKKVYRSIGEAAGRFGLLDQGIQ